MSTDFDLDRPWRLAEQVAMRPERFGALLYHFGTRRLSFLKSERLATVVRTLADHPTARAACAAAGVGPAELPAVTRSLAVLADTRLVTQRHRP